MAKTAKQSYVCVGTMSGTSLDGVDMCAVEFTEVKGEGPKWLYDILKAETIPYSKEWEEKLKTAHTMSGKDLAKLHVEYGHLMGKEVANFIKQFKKEVHLVAVHGHTIFHQPVNERFTFQLGDGETMVSHLQVPLVANFRNKDVALGGQGAPLVPLGDKLLFEDHDICLNLGGIANISIHGLGFDICPCNMLMNYLAMKYDATLDYDKDGKIAAKGKIIQEVSDQLNELSFYKLLPPKSLGREWFEEEVLQYLDCKKYLPEDLLHTSVEHIATQISSICANAATLQSGGEKRPQSLTQLKSMLITGGGALNNYLIDSLKAKMTKENPGIEIVVPGHDVINFKEALVFAFLGLRCMLGLPNILSQVTGAKVDSVSGSIHVPPDSRRKFLI